MREFFRSWRRKAACVTLVLALASMGLWLRSLIREDVYVLIKGDGAMGHVVSRNGGLHWRQAYLQEMPEGEWQIEHMDTSPFPDPKGLDDQEFRWIWRFAGNGVGRKIDESPEIFVQYVVISYSSFAIPFALLSTYLLLVKPRTKMPVEKKADQESR